MAEPEQQPHPEGHEAFHLPPPSIWPPVLAVGIAMLLTGLIPNPLISLTGAAITNAAIALSVREAPREVAELSEQGSYLILPRRVGCRGRVAQSTPQLS